MRLAHNHLILLVAAAALSSCVPCDRSGCDALGLHLNAQGTGLMGVIATESDVVTNGCQECPYGEAFLEIWQLDAPVPDEAAAAAVVAAGQAEVSGSAQEHHLVELDPGDYLFCHRPSCINVEVTSGEMFTVNVALRDGPTSFLVGRRGITPEETFGFDVSE